MTQQEKDKWMQDYKEFNKERRKKGNAYSRKYYSEHKEKWNEYNTKKITIKNDTND